MHSHLISRVPGAYEMHYVISTQFIQHMCGPAFFNMRPHSMGETHFFVFFVLLENHLKNGLESPLIFVLF